MSGQLTADVLNVLRGAGIAISLTADFDIAARPAAQLQPKHRDLIKGEKLALVTYLARAEAKARQLVRSETNMACEQYCLHHFKCSTCIAAGLGYGKRCAEGKAKWFHYQLYGFIRD